MSAKNVNTIVLYSYYRSSCAWRVRIALTLKGLNYEYRAINIKPGEDEQLSDQFQKINPISQVPVLVVNDITLTQSIPIMEYLEEMFPEPYLLPRSAIERAEVRAICELIASGIQPLQNLGVLMKLPVEQRAEWPRHFITRGFKALETQLSKTARKYCFGDTLTMADCCLVPQVYNARRFGVDLSQFPLISRLDRTLSELDAFKKAHADVQPDAPK